jgi:hypothetical protein
VCAANRDQIISLLAHLPSGEPPVCGILEERKEKEMPRK